MGGGADHSQKERRFKFQTFTERLNALDINVSRTLEVEEQLEGLETHFSSALLHWQGINLTEAWSECMKEMYPLCLSLPLLVHNCQKIVDVLLDNLYKQKEIKDCPGAEPVIALISALARDLRKDLVPFLPRIFQSLRDLILPQNAQLLEYIFQCHSYLVKYLGRYMVEDLENYLELYKPLFIHNKLFIRHFAAESFSYLLRRMETEEQMKNAVNMLYAMEFEEEHMIVGYETLSIILFETTKSIQNQFHSKALTLVEILLEKNKEATIHHRWILKAMLLRMRCHAKSMENAEGLLELFFDNFSTEATAETLWYLDVVIAWVKTVPHISGNFGPFVKQTIQLLKQIDSDVVVQSVNLEDGALSFPPKPTSIRNAVGRCLMQLWRCLPESFLTCMQEEMDAAGMVPKASRKKKKKLSKSDVPVQVEASSSHQFIQVEFQFFVESLQWEVPSFDASPFLSPALNQSISIISDASASEDERTDAYFVLKKIIAMDVSITQSPKDLFFLKHQGVTKSMIECIIAWFTYRKATDEIKAELLNKVEEILQSGPEVSIHALLVQLVSFLIPEGADWTKKTKFIEEWWAEHWNHSDVVAAIAEIGPRMGVPAHNKKHFFMNMGSPNALLRENTLKILEVLGINDKDAINREVTAVNENGELTEGDVVADPDDNAGTLISYCLNLEQMPSTLENERSKTHLIRTICTLVSKSRHTWMAHAAVRLVLAQWWVPFSTLWRPVVEACVSLLEMDVPKAERIGKKKKKEATVSVDGWWNNVLWKLVAKLITDIHEHEEQKRLKESQTSGDESDEDVEEETEEKPKKKKDSQKYVHKTKGQNIRNKRELKIDDFTTWNEEPLFHFQKPDTDTKARSTDHVTVDEWAWKLLGALLEKSKENKKHMWVTKLTLSALEGRYHSVKGGFWTRPYFLHIIAAASKSLQCPKEYQSLIRHGCVHDMLLDHDSSVGKHAIEFLARLKETKTVVEKYKTELLRLLEDKFFREAMLGLALNGSEDDKFWPRPEHVNVLEPMVHRILFAKAFKRGAAIDKNSSQHARRTAIFSHLAPHMDENNNTVIQLLIIMVQGLLTSSNINKEDSDFLIPGTLLQASIDRHDTIAQVLGSYDPEKNPAQWCTKEKVFAWGDLQLRTDDSKNLRNRYFGFLQTLGDFIGQVQYSLIGTSQYLVEMCISILEQTTTAIVAAGRAPVEEGSRQRTMQRSIARGCLQRIHSLMKLCPEAISWKHCLQPAHGTLTHLIEQIPVAAGSAQVSAITSFVCLWAEIPDVYELYEVFPSVLPALCQVPCASSMIASISHSNLSGSPCLDLVVDTVLRLCRGGVLNEKAVRKEAKAFREIAKQQRKRKRENADDSNEDEEMEDEEDVNAAQCGGLSLVERREIAKRGQALLQPHVNQLLQAFQSLVSTRRSRRTKRNDPAVRLSELDLLATVSEWTTDCPVAAQLTDLLLLALADNPNIRNAQVSLYLLDTLLRLTPKALPWAQEEGHSIVSANKRIGTLLGKVRDVRVRQKTCEVLVCCEASLHLKEEATILDYMQRAKAVPWIEKCHPDLSAAAGLLPNNGFTAVHMAHVVHALNALRVVAVLEPDADLHVDVLERIVAGYSQTDTDVEMGTTTEKSDIKDTNTTITTEGSFKPLSIPSQFLSPLCSHVTFVLASDGADMGVRHSIERLLMAMGTTLGQKADVDKFPDSIDLLYVLCTKVVPSLRRTLRVPIEAAMHAALKVLGHYVRTLGPVAKSMWDDREDNLFRFGSSCVSIFHTDLGVLMKDTETSGNEGGDLFRDLLHLQKHRRGRGLLKLAKAIKGDGSNNECILSNSTLTNIVLPLCYQGILQRSAQTQNFDPNFAENSMVCLAAAISKAQWSGCLLYVKLLSTSLKKWFSRERIIIKAICTCLSAFPFEGEGNRGGPKQRKKKTPSDVKDVKQKELEVPKEPEEKDENEGEDGDEGVEEDEVDTSEKKINTVDMGESLKKRIVPVLKKLLWEKGQKKETTQRGNLGKEATPSKKDRGMIRVGVIGVLLHVFRYLQVTDFHREVPRLLYQLMEALESRDKNYREETRKAIQTAMAALGPEWFVWLSRELHERLTKGYQLPICMTAVHSALSVLVSQDNKHSISVASSSFAGRCEVGAIDASLPILLQLVEAELARVADPEKTEEEQKERKGLIKEAKQIRGPDLLHLVARVTLPEDILTKVVQFLYDLLCEERGIRVIGSAASRAYSRKYLNRIQELLHQTLRGVEHNSAFDVPNKIDFVRSLLNNGMELLAHTPGSTNLFGSSKIEKENVTVQGKKEKAMTVQDGAAAGRGVWTGKSRQSGFDAHARAEVLAGAGLNLMLKLFVKNVEKAEEKSVRAALKELAPHTVKCFSSSKDTLCVNAAKVLMKLQSWIPLSPDLGRTVALTVLKVFQFASGQSDLSDRLLQRSHGLRAGGQELIPACSKLLTHLLNRDQSRQWFSELSNTPLYSLEGRTEFDPLSKKATKKMKKESATFLDALVAQIQVALDHRKLQPSALALLRKVILKRSVVRASVYDCVDVVGELMVKAGTRAHDTSLPKLCASIYVDFLVEYPHEPAGLEKRLHFLIRNLNYSEEGGRRALLNALHNVVSTFPTPLITKYAPMIFLPVAARLSQESDPLTHEMLHILIKGLWERVDSDTRQQLYATIVGWEKSPKPLLLAALAEAIGVMTPYLGPKQRSKVLEICANLVQTIDTTGCDHISSMWRAKYCACKSFEDLFKLYPEESANPILFNFLFNEENALVPSVDRHPWVVSVALRILSECPTKIGRSLGPLLKQVTTFLCHSVEEHPTLAHPAMKTVVQVTRAILADSKLAKGGPSDQDLATLTNKEDDSEIESESEDIEMNEPLFPVPKEEVTEQSTVADTDVDMKDVEDEEKEDEDMEEKNDDRDDDMEENEEEKEDESEDEAIDVPEQTLYEQAAADVAQPKKEVDSIEVERASSSTVPPALRWCIIRLSYESRKMMANVQAAAVRLGTIVRLFGHWSVLLPKEILAELLEAFITPCYRLQSLAANMPTQELKDITELSHMENNLVRGCLGVLAQETMEALQNAMGDDVRLTQALQKVRSSVMEKRRQRKADERIKMVQRPELASKKKVAKHQKNKKLKKRRKNEVVKQKRGLIQKGAKG